LLAWTCSTVVVLWALGRIFTDRFYATQFLFWIPTPVVLAVGVALLAASRLSAPHRDAPRRPRSIARAVAALALFAALVHAVIEARLFAPAPDSPVTDRTLRVVYWNPSWGTTPGLAEEVRRADADVFVIGDQPTDVPWERVRDAMGGSRSALWALNSVILARHPIIRWGATSLEIDGAWEQRRTNPDGTLRLTRQRGRAIWVELDTTEAFGRDLIFWVIDMPSDPFLSRAYSGRQADRAVRDWRGPAYRRSRAGPYVPDLDAHHGFPAPDLIVGDFNTHRGAASLAELTRGTRPAFNLAGRGLLGTFPRQLPLWHLDQAFAAPSVRVLSYRLRNPGEGRHWMQIIHLEAAH
jgi:hypothetical protein